VLRIDPATNRVDKTIKLLPCWVEVGELTLGLGTAVGHCVEVGFPRSPRIVPLEVPLFAGKLANTVHARDVAEAILAAPHRSEASRASERLLQGLALLVAEGPGAGTPVSRQALELFRGEAVTTDERLRWSWLAGRTAAIIWDYDTWDALITRQLEVARAAGAFGMLPLTLSESAGVRLFAGLLSEAEALIEQVEAVADATDARTARYAAVAVAAFRGYEQEARDSSMPAHRTSPLEAKEWA
jgi:hypothetical protein